MQDKLPKIRSLPYSPTVNPLIETAEVRVRRRLVSTGIRRDLVDAQTGEITGASVIRTVEEKDDAEFVKVFAAGVSAMYELTKTAARVFQRVLDQYQREPMVNGYADSIQLTWFGDGLNGEAVDMSEATFNRGMRELLAKGFIAPRTPTLLPPLTRGSRKPTTHSQPWPSSTPAHAGLPLTRNTLISLNFLPSPFIAHPR
jgi:hypothetical protein